MRIIFVL